ncbi:MAG: NUDIX hydrolase, partial [Anaerolineae bacterium]
RSAGGVVVRRRDEQLEVALILVGSQEEKRWQLPKGWLEKGEDSATAAVREVGEETGLEVEIIEKLPTIDFWFYEGPDTRVHKFVAFYLMRATGGDVEQHDNEVAAVRWFPLEEAIEAQAFDSEQELVREVGRRLSLR